MRMNMSKVLVGGIIAGIVMLAIDFVTNTYLLGPQYVAQMEAYKPGSGAAMMSGNAKLVYPLLDLIIGIALVWLYAAIRPRFGPGPKTAFIAALFTWVISCIAYYGYLQMGMMSSALWWEFGLVGLITLTIAAMIGGRFYTEETTA